MARHIVRSVLASAFALVVLGWAAPASAQMGTLRGKVVNKDGKPVDAVEIVLDFVGDIKRQVKTQTDKNGEWIKAGMPVGGGTWTVTAKKFELSGTAAKITVRIGETVKVPDITILTEGDRSKGVSAPVSNEAAAAAAKANAELEKLLAEVEA